MPDAMALGFEVGFMGGTEADCPYEMGSDEGAEWGEGWHDGRIAREMEREAA